MVDNSFSVSIFCVCAAILAIMLRQYNKEQSMLISRAACTAVISGFTVFLQPVINDVREIFTEAGISDSYLALVFKAAAICFVTQITCDICTDSGESAIASAAELWGRGELTLMSLPVIRSLLEQIGDILQ